MPLTHALATRVVTDLVDKYHFDNMDEDNSAEYLQMKTSKKGVILHWGFGDEDWSVQLNLSRWDGAHASRWVIYVEVKIFGTEMEDINEATKMGIRVEMIEDPISAPIDDPPLVNQYREVTNENEWNQFLNDVVLESIDLGFEIEDDEEKEHSDDDTDPEKEHSDDDD